MSALDAPDDLPTQAANFSDRLSTSWTVPGVLTAVRCGAGVRAALRRQWLVLVLAVAAGCGGGAERLARVSIELFPVYARAHGASVDIFALHPPREESWMLTFDGQTHPHEVVRAAMASELRSEPLVVHSTSWRHDAESHALILTNIAVIAARNAPSGFVEQRIERAPLARGGATTPPARIRTAAVLSHAMEHLAWLLRVDPAIRSALPPEWGSALAPYVPEPFRQLSGTP
jgi:hypothetical protein